MPCPFLTSHFFSSFFFASRQQEPARAGGPRRIYYYLIDSKGNKTLCMMGEERDKNDSHYIYRTVGVFDQLKPYTCGNNSNAQK